MTTFKDYMPYTFRDSNLATNIYLVFYKNRLRYKDHYITEIGCIRDFLLYHLELSYKTRYPAEIAEDLFKIRYPAPEPLKMEDQYYMKWDQETQTLKVKGHIKLLISIKSSLREDIDIDTILRMSKGLVAYEYRIEAYSLKEVLYTGYDKNLLEYMYGEIN